MPVKVIDASAVAALLFSEPSAETVVDQVREYSLAAPTLLTFEIASVCLKKLRRYPSQRSLLLEAHSLFARLHIAKTDVDCEAVIRLAEDRRLTVYDAAYLWLAYVLRTELVTLDKKLAAAARNV